MTRWLRYIPTPEGSHREVVEIMGRSVRSIFLLSPSKRWNDRVLGIIGRAQRLTGVEIHNLDYQVNHFHMVVSVKGAKQLANFMQRVQQQTSVELRILRKWSGPAWEGAYRLSYPGRDEADLARRFRYVLAQGCQAGLVSSPKKWPGVNAARALCSGKFELEGIWIDHTALGRARRTKAGRRSPESDFSTKEKVILAKLPGWKEMSDEEYCAWVRKMVRSIEQETRERHKSEGTRPLGAWKVGRVSPYRIPKKVSWGPRKRVTATNEEERIRLLTSLFSVFESHREARERLWAGDLDVKFPVGTFPSPLPYVGLEPGRAGP